MKIKKLLLFFVLTPLFAFTGWHKYYVSLTQIDYSNTSKALQITMNVFVDDMELALNKTYNKALKLETNDEFPDTDVYFKEYLNTHFKVKLNGKEVAYSFLGKEYESDIVYFFIEIDNVTEVSSLEIENTMLTDFFPSQRNLIKIAVNKNFESLLLTKENKSGLVKF